MILSKLHNGQPKDYTGTKAEISAAVIADGYPDPFAIADTRTAKQKAKDAFLALPVEVQSTFLGEWATINNALDNGAKAAAIARFDSLAVPAELVDAKASIRTHLEAI